MKERITLRQKIIDAARAGATDYDIARVIRRSEAFVRKVKRQHVEEELPEQEGD